MRIVDAEVHHELLTVHAAMLIKGNHITEIVVGESLDLSGEENALQARIGVFIDELHDRFNLPVRKQKEFLTSVEARKSTNTKSNSHKSLSHFVNLQLQRHVSSALTMLLKLQTR